MNDITKLVQSWDLPREVDVYRAANDYAERLGDKWPPTLLMMGFRAGARWAREKMPTPPVDIEQMIECCIPTTAGWCKPSDVADAIRAYWKEAAHET